MIYYYKLFLIFALHKKFKKKIKDLETETKAKRLILRIMCSPVELTSPVDQN